MADLFSTILVFTSFGIDAWIIPSLDITVADPIMYPLGHTAYMSSTYLIVLLSFHRFLAISWRKEFTNMETKKHIMGIHLYLPQYCERNSCHNVKI